MGIQASKHNNYYIVTLNSNKSSVDNIKFRDHSSNLIDIDKNSHLYQKAFDYYIKHKEELKMNHVFFIDHSNM